ncbi:MAG: hypothetical protein KAQ68_01070 [Clostridiales bacterium]|nr:hypothetical protein [Clostridiales bacterium]
MKFFKGLFLVIAVFCIVVVLLVLQTQFALQKTLLSPDYFDKKYSENEMSDVVGEIITAQITSLPEKMTSGLSEDGEGAESDTGEGMAQLVSSLDFEGLIDVDWLQEQIELTVNGMYSYFTASTDELPTLDIVPMKEMLLEAVVSQMKAHSGIEGDLDVVDLIVNEYDKITGGSPEDIVDEDALKQIEGGENSAGFASDILGLIIKVSKDVDKKLGVSERMEAIMIEVVKEQMHYDDINDELDMNELFDTMFPDGSNPLEAARSIIIALKTTLFYALLTLLLLLILMVIVAAFRPASILGWLSAPLIISGLVVTGLSVLEMILFKITNINISLPVETLGDSADKVIDFVRSYIDGAQRFVLIQGLVLLVVGIVFAILAAVLSKVARKRATERAGEEKPKRGWLTLIRVFVVLGLMVVTFITMRSYYNKISDDIQDAVETLQSAQERLEDGAIVDAVTKTTGITFLNFGDGE